MTLNDFIGALRKYPDANELRVYSDGGYFYSVVGASGKKITPDELGIKLDLDFDGGDYVRVDGNVYSHTATITRSKDIDVDAHVRDVAHTSDSNTIIVKGDIP